MAIDFAATRHTVHLLERHGRLLSMHAAAADGAAGAGDPPAATVNPLRNVVIPNALALLLCNMDRICLSVAILPMAAEFGWTPSTVGLIQASFLWGYMATQLLGGTLADAIGGKRVMAAGIAWFSLASVLTPLALSPAPQHAGLLLPAILAARFAVGLGEGVALPSMNHLVARHVPPASKASSLGMVFSGFHCGNLVGLAVSPVLLLTLGWRALFLVFGVLGGPLLATWLWLVPGADTPGHAAQGGGPPPSSDAVGLSFGTMLRSSSLWAIIIVNFVNHWGYFIYLNWMPTYFNSVLGLDLRASTLFSFLPWVAMAVGSSASGFFADALLRSGVRLLTVRKAMQSTAFLGSALPLLLLAQPGISPVVAAVCFTLALGLSSLGQAGFVANMSDIAPEDAGRTFGLCNTFGSAAGILGVTAVGLIVQATGSYDIVFKLTAGMYVAAVLVWLKLCRVEPIAPVRRKA